MLTVKQFIYRSYRLISASNPTTTLHGDDELLGIDILNQLLDSFAATGLLLTIAKTVSIPLSIGQEFVVVGPASAIPTPDITLGRLANLETAKLLLNGVTYPLIDKSRDEFDASFKYDPLKGLPRFVIPYPDTDVVNLRIYPAPSQFFEFILRAKFQLSNLRPTDTLDGLPGYYQRFLSFAAAKDIAMYKGRADAWTPKLEAILQEAQDIVESASEVNLSITGDRASLLNGSWRVRAGI